jgi:hypothetical protein
MIATAKLNGVDPQPWLADVLARLPDHPAKRIHELLPWQWCGIALACRLTLPSPRAMMIADDSRGRSCAPRHVPMRFHSTASTSRRSTAS